MTDVGTSLLNEKRRTPQNEKKSKERKDWKERKDGVERSEKKQGKGNGEERGSREKRKKKIGTTRPSPYPTVPKKNYQVTK